MFMKEKTDLRVVKTKNVLYNSLIELMKEKEFEEIKVSDICTKALINRSTFYAHYQDKYELLQDFLNFLKEEFVKELEKSNKNLNIRDYYIQLISLFLDHIEDKKDIYNTIMVNNRNSIMMDILLSVVNNDVLKRLELDDIKTRIPREVIAKFYLGGVINIGVEWINGTGKYTKEDLINYLKILIPEDILSL